MNITKTERRILFFIFSFDFNLDRNNAFILGQQDYVVLFVSLIHELATAEHSFSVVRFSKMADRYFTRGQHNATQ